nr:GDSL-type esterase/lipase family protein [uncultured Treponema sp.]
MNDWIGIVDCRVDDSLENDYLTLNLWGKPVFEYPLGEVSKFDFDKIIVLANTGFVKNAVSNLYGNTVSIKDDFDYKAYQGKKVLYVSGRAPLVKFETMQKAINMYKTGILSTVVETRNVKLSFTLNNISLLGNVHNEEKNVFVLFDGSSEFIKHFELTPMESVVINSKNDFELALILKKKELNAPILRKQILARIEEKKIVFASENKNGICLIGHSQIDFWGTENIKNHKVRNCGIAGISSKEYYDDILSKNLLTCSEDLYLVMHGTNDIVYELDMSEIVCSVQKTVDYIRERKPEAKIYFLKCITVNGRLDRSNKTILKLNNALKQSLKDVIMIETSSMNDEYGLLKKEYTKDGLHLSEKGYGVLKKIVEEAINE